MIPPAILELKIVIATLVRSFHFNDTGKKVETRISPSLLGKVDGEVGVIPLKISRIPGV